MAGRSRYHSLHPGQRESFGEERSLWDREVHLPAGPELLCLSGRQTIEVRGHQSAEPDAPLLLHPEAVSGMLPERAVYAWEIPHHRHTCLRSGETESLCTRQDSAVCGSIAQATESGSTVLRTEEPGWAAATAAPPDQVRTRTVLPGGGCTESETAGAVPYLPAATDTGLELNNRTEGKGRRVLVKENKGTLHGCFQTTFSTATRSIANQPECRLASNHRTLRKIGGPKLALLASVSYPVFFKPIRDSESSFLT